MNRKKQQFLRPRCEIAVKKIYELVTRINTRDFTVAQIVTVKHFQLENCTEAEFLGQTGTDAKLKSQGTIF